MRSKEERFLRYIPAVLVIALPIFGPSAAPVGLVALCAHQHTQLGMP